MVRKLLHAILGKSPLLSFHRKSAAILKPRGDERKQPRDQIGRVIARHGVPPSRTKPWMGDEVDSQLLPPCADDSLRWDMAFACGEVMTEDVIAIVAAVIERAPEWVRTDLCSRDSAARARAEETLAAMMAAALRDARADSAS